MKPKKKRKRCLTCRALFRPDPRLKGKHRYCSKPECQRKRQRANEDDWLRRHAECREYKRDQTKAWWKAHPDYSKLRRQKSPVLLKLNRRQSCERMRERRLKRWFDKTKSILMELMDRQGDKCYLERSGEWLHLRLTKPSRWRWLDLSEDNARLVNRPNRLRKGRLYDLSQEIFNRSP